MRLEVHYLNNLNQNYLIGQTQVLYFSVSQLLTKNEWMYKLTNEPMYLKNVYNCIFITTISMQYIPMSITIIVIE